jgi:hypothetical protein
MKQKRTEKKSIIMKRMCRLFLDVFESEGDKISRALFCTRQLKPTKQPSKNMFRSSVQQKRQFACDKAQVSAFLHENRACSNSVMFRARQQVGKKAMWKASH